MKKTIEEIVQEYGVEITPEGGILRAYCPFHNDTGRPNFTVYPETDSYFCFACNEGGDIASFVAKIENISYGEAKKRIEGVHVELEELQSKLDGVQVETDLVLFNDELNVLVSKMCKKFLQKHPEQSARVLELLKTFDHALQQPISYNQMKQILDDVKQRLSKVE